MRKSLRQNRKPFRFTCNSYDVKKSFFLSERNYAIRITSLSRQLSKYKIGFILNSMFTVCTAAGSGLWQHLMHFLMLDEIKSDERINPLMKFAHLLSSQMFYLKSRWSFPSVECKSTSDVDDENIRISSLRNNFWKRMFRSHTFERNFLKIHWKSRYIAKSNTPI